MPIESIPKTHSKINCATWRNPRSFSLLGFYFSRESRGFWYSSLSYTVSDIIHGGSAEIKYWSCFFQENDYMSLLFHLYDSDHEADDEDDGDEARPDTIQMALLR